MDIKPKQKKGINWSEYKEKGIIDSGFALNTTALEIWKMCDGNNSITDISRFISENYNVDFETAKRDVKKIIEQFEKLGLLE